MESANQDEILRKIEEKITLYPGFPKEGILFR